VRPAASDALEPALYLDIVRRALAEDVRTGDLTSEWTVAPDARARGVILAKSWCVVAGLAIATAVFRELDPAVAVTLHRQDGDRCESGTVVAEIRGLARPMLAAERTALNLLQRLSGIATLTRRFVDAAGGRVAILDTRKTTPTLRALEKYAVRAGGGTNHRAGLDDGVLIKDNHIRLAGGVAEAVARMRMAGSSLPIEVEAQDLAQVDEALGAGAAIVLLDNMPTADVRRAVTVIAGRARVEISGGITLERMPELASTGADDVSVGALTHSAPAADLSLEVEPDEAC
jgi:nicotinate-nucleotide pyrophosphorylase (carboxylating)